MLNKGILTKKTREKKSATKWVEYLTKKYEKTFKNNCDFGIKKQYLMFRPTCRVTFRLPKDAAPEAQSVTIVGDFNNWDVNRIPLTRQKDGTFTVTIDLERNREYEFRYLIDSTKWENDWNADKYIPAPYGDSENSVVTV